MMAVSVPALSIMHHHMFLALLEVTTSVILLYTIVLLVFVAIGGWKVLILSGMGRGVVQLAPAVLSTPHPGSSNISPPPQLMT